MADAAPGPGVDPVVDGVPIEDGSALTGNVWKTLEAEGASLGLPDLKVQTLKEFLQTAELQKMTAAEKHSILDQAVLLFDHLYPLLTFKKKLFGDFADPGENLAAIPSQLDTLGETDFHSHVSACFGMVLDPHTWYGLPSPWRGAVTFLPFQLGFWMDRERNTHFVVTAVMNATPNGGLGHPFFRPGAEILRWNTNDIQSELSRQALERLPVRWGETKMTHWVGPATVVPLRFCLPPDDPAATFHYNGRACDNKDASERCRRLNTGHHDFRRRMASCTSHGGHVWSLGRYGVRGTSIFWVLSAPEVRAGPSFQPLPRFFRE